MQSSLLDRRSFVASFAAALALPRRSLSSQVTQPRTVLPRDRLSAITDEIGDSEASAFAFARHYGLQWIEVRLVPGTGDAYAELAPSALRQFRTRADDAGLRVSFLNTSILKWTLPGTEPLNRHRYPAAEWTSRAREDSLRLEKRADYVKRALEAAHILGVPIVRIFTFWRIAQPQPLYARIADLIAPLADLAAQEGVQLLIENESACNVATSAEIRQMLGLLPHPAIGLNWDPHNSLPYEPEPFPAGYSILPHQRLGNVQIKGESLLIHGQILDWRSITETLRADGYRGHFGLETHFGPGEERFQNAHASMRAILRFTEDEPMA